MKRNPLVSRKALAFFDTLRISANLLRKSPMTCILEKSQRKPGVTMSDSFPMKVIATMRSPFPAKFGIPRQSGLVDSLRSTIVFEPEYRNPDALRGLESFSHLWVIWSFSKAIREDWSPTVRPPRLGGNTRMGVFATRSPFRPNAIGLSSVKIERIEQDPRLGPVIHVTGADLLDRTPIFDIKPYLPYTDSHPDALGGFTDGYRGYRLEVDFPQALLEKVPVSARESLIGVLAQDPRPSYQDDPDRVYGMAFGTVDVKFQVSDGVLTVIGVEPVGC